MLGTAAAISWLWEEDKENQRRQPYILPSLRPLGVYGTLSIQISCYARKIDCDLCKLLLAIFSCYLQSNHDFLKYLFLSAFLWELGRICFEPVWTEWMHIGSCCRHYHHHLQGISLGWSHWRAGKREMVKDFVSSLPLMSSCTGHGGVPDIGERMER